MRDWQFVVRSEKGKTSEIAVLNSFNHNKLLYAFKSSSVDVYELP